MDVLNTYEIEYPLLDDERMLLIILIQMPPLLNFGLNEYKNTIEVKKMLDTLDRAFNLEQAFETTP